MFILKYFLTILIIGLFFISFICVYAQEAADPNPGCFDTDAGKNYYKKGEATDFLLTTPVHDYCTINGREVSSCIPSEGDESCGIIEKYCTSYQRVSGSYLSGDDFLTICPLGCRDGACIIPDNPGKNTCFDTEEKKNYSNKGEAVALGGISLEEYCHSDNQVMEYYCQDNDVYSSLYYCPNGCNDGACIDIDHYQKVDAECNETDDGDDIYNYGYIYDTGIRNADECFGDELLEYYCEDNEKKHKQIKCESGCVNGACIEEEGCFDSDGMDYSTKGYATSTNYLEVKYDYCQDYSVSEYYCGGMTSSTLLNKTIRCEAFCIDGACTRDIADCLKFTGNDQEKCYIGFAKYKKEAPGHTKEEAIMILNHKKAIDYSLGNKTTFRTINVAKIENFHKIITDQLGIKNNIRKSKVGIVGTKYLPLDNQYQIREALKKTVDLVNAQIHPLEKAILINLLITYIQPFEDGNKRTSRLLANAILHAHDYSPLSFVSIDTGEYKKAILLFYEQNSALYFKELFTEQFKFAVNNYFL